MIDQKVIFFVAITIFLAKDYAFFEIIAIFVANLNKV
jgi:hypothetical protein